jgi:hypothetical protein
LLPSGDQPSLNDQTTFKPRLPERSVSKSWLQSNNSIPWGLFLSETHLDTWFRYRSSLVKLPLAIANLTRSITCDLKSVDVALLGAVKEIVTVTMMRLTSVRAVSNEF